MSETPLYKIIQHAASLGGHRLLRNNTGAFMDESGRWIRFGLGNESKTVNEHIKFGDLIGVTRKTITKHDLGTTLAVFTNIEVKPDGWVLRPGDARAQAQLRAIELVRQLGGIAGFATGPEDYYKIINGGK